LSKYHNILGISINASKSDIKKAYRTKAMVVHPDVNNSPEAQKLFIELAEAYEFLMSGKYISKNTHQKTTTKQKKYWDVYQPPTDEKEYNEWKKVDDERKAYFKQKSREEAINRQKIFERDFDKFRKSNWYYPLLILYYFMMLLFYLVAISSILIPIYVKWHQADYNFTDETILLMSICTIFVSFTLFYYLKDLKKTIDPYFYN